MFLARHQGPPPPEPAPVAPGYARSALPRATALRSSERRGRRAPKGCPPWHFGAHESTQEKAGFKGSPTAGVWPSTSCLEHGNRS